MVMSKALCLAGWFTSAISRQHVTVGSDSPAGTSELQPADGSIAPSMFLIAIGLPVLLAWIIRRMVSRNRFSLAGTPGRPNDISPAHLLLPFLAWFACGALASVIPWLKDPPQQTFGLVFAQFVWLGTSLLVAKACFPLGLARGLGLSGRHWVYDSLRAIAAYLAVVPVCLVALSLTTHLFNLLNIELHRQGPLEQIVQIAIAWKLLVIFSAAILAPVVEEIFFRGLCQTAFRKHLRSPWAAVLLTSLIFALIHAPYWQIMPALFALSIALGYTYERSGRLVSPILIHAIFNAVNIALVLRGGE